MVHSCLVTRHNIIKRPSWILVAIFQKFFTTVDSIGMLKWCQSLGTHLVQTFFTPKKSLMILWSVVFEMPNLLATRRTEICRSDITISSITRILLSVSAFSVRPLRGVSSKARVELLNSATHFATVRYDGAE